MHDIAAIRKDKDAWVAGGSRRQRGVEKSGRRTVDFEMEQSRMTLAHRARIIWAGFFGCFIAAAGTTLLPTPSGAATLKTLHSFCSKTDCVDGREPRAGLVGDAAGNLYGITSIGGKENAGVVFQISPDRSEHVLHQFCLSCADGKYPNGNLVIDVNGNLFGTTDSTVFKFQPDPDHKNWKFIVLHTFCGYCGDGGGANGLTYRGAEIGEPYDGTSPLYGTTQFGGPGGLGTVFQLDFRVGKQKPKETILYNFCSEDGCPDGSQPEAGLAVDAAGNLYGTTNSGGSKGAGVVFELSPPKGSYTETVLYSVCQLTGCADGGYPQTAPVTVGPDGNIYGTASNGGAHNQGVVFKVVPNGENSTETVLYSFCADQGDCADGSYPLSGVTFAANGDLIGTTAGGGPHGAGTVFALHAGSESVVYGFGALPNSADGARPLGNLVIDSSGVIYGTTLGGGKASKKTGFADGTVWKLTT